MIVKPHNKMTRDDWWMEYGFIIKLAIAVGVILTAFAVLVTTAVDERTSRNNKKWSQPDTTITYQHGKWDTVIVIRKVH